MIQTLIVFVFKEIWLNGHHHAFDCECVSGTNRLLLSEQARKLFKYVDNLRVVQILRAGVLIASLQLFVNVCYNSSVKSPY